MPRVALATAATAALLLLLQPLVADAYSAYWTLQKPTTTGPSPRIWATGVCLSGSMYIFGGGPYSGRQDYEDLWKYSEDADSWEQLAQGPPGSWFASDGDAIGGSIVVFGGLDGGSGQFSNQLWKFTTATNVWSQIQLAPLDQPPPTRDGHSLVTIGDDIYIFGGYDSNQYFNDLWRYSIPVNDWQDLYPASNRPPARNGHSMLSFGGSIYIFGGFSHDPQKPNDQTAFQFFNDLWAFNLDLGTWQQIYPRGSLPAARFGHSASVVAGLMIIYGGNSDPDGRDFNSDLWAYNFAENIWIQMDPKNVKPPSLQSQVACTIGNDMLMFGGRTSWNGTTEDSLWILHVDPTDYTNSVLIFPNMSVKGLTAIDSVSLAATVITTILVCVMAFFTLRDRIGECLMSVSDRFGRKENQRDIAELSGFLADNRDVDDYDQ